MNCKYIKCIIPALRASFNNYFIGSFISSISPLIILLYYNNIIALIIDIVIALISIIGLLFWNKKTYHNDTEQYKRNECFIIVGMVISIPPYNTPIRNVWITIMIIFVFCCVYLNYEKLINQYGIVDDYSPFPLAEIVVSDSAYQSLEECAICIEELSENVVCLNKCSHIYHKDCIKRWLLEKRSCPICRAVTN